MIPRATGRSVVLPARPFHSDALNLTKLIEYVKKTSMSARILIILTLLFWAHIGDVGAQPGGETRLFLLRGDTLHILNSSDGSELDQQKLDTPAGRSFDLLFGTPGGKYIFVVDSVSGLGLAVDFEDPAESKPIDISAAAPLSTAVFSPMGDVLYAVKKDSGRIFSFNHRAGELGEEVLIQLSGASENGKRIALNSRGTRIYSSGSDGLLYFLVSDGSRIKLLAGVPGDLDWIMAPGGRYLWGSGQDGWIVVDEQRGRVAAQLPADLGQVPVFDSSGRTGWALAESGRLLVELDLRRNRLLQSEQQTESLTGPAPGSGGLIWLAGKDRLYSIRSGEGVQVGGNLPGSGSVKAFVSVTLRPGQGFACF